MGIDFAFSHLFFLGKEGAAILATAILLDLTLGDRTDLPHPVRMMGAIINACEKIARASRWPEMLSGSIMAAVLVIATYLGAYLVFDWLKTYSFIVLFIVASVAIYFCISLKCLADEALEVSHCLENNDLISARKKISMLVSRDTKEMTEEDISKAVIETVSENLVDGIISPFFYAALGGPALCICFKMISTLDSMIGYKDDRYRFFGRLAARMDDLANLIPARLSVPVIAVNALFWGSSPRRVFSCVFNCAHLHESPNSGFPESAFAAALDVRLGGKATYFGKTRRYPVINMEGATARPSHIRQAVRLLYTCSLSFFSIFIIPTLVLAFF